MPKYIDHTPPAAEEWRPSERPTLRPAPLASFHIKAGKRPGQFVEEETYTDGSRTAPRVVTTPALRRRMLPEERPSLSKEFGDRRGFAIFMEMRKSEK